MKEFQWSQTLETGVEEIDDDHRHLFLLAQAIASAVEGRNHEQCRTAAERFLEAAQKHFAEEEKFLAQAGWPGLEEHKRYHAQLLTKAIALKKVCDEKGKQGNSQTLYFDLIAFVIDDALRGDYQFKSYLEYHGYSKRSPGLGRGSAGPARRGVLRPGRLC